MPELAPHPPKGPRTGFARRQCLNTESSIATEEPQNYASESTRIETAEATQQCLDTQSSIATDDSSNYASVSSRTETAETMQDPLEHVRQKAAEAFNALADSPVLCLSLIGGAIADLNAILAEVPRGVCAIVVLCMLSRRMEVHRCLQGICAAKHPVIILCADEAVPFDRKEISDAHRFFLGLGASDVVLQWHVPDLRLEVDMKVQTASHAVHMSRVTAKNRLQDEQKNMFWPFVDRILEGFPKLDKRHGLAIESGAQIGSRTLLNRIDDRGDRKIFKCLNNEDGCLEVLKAVSKDAVGDMADVIVLQNEITLLQQLEHPNVVRLKAAMHKKSHVLVFMDFAGSKNLHTYMRGQQNRIHIDEAMFINRQILAGVAHCHRNHVAHRDLKPENVVVKDRDDACINIQLVDFGLAVKSTQSCKDFVGTVPFIAPEVAVKSDDEQYSPTRADMWALGVIFLELLTGVGKVKRMLRSLESPRSRLEYREQLEWFFSGPGRITASVEEDLGTVGSASFPKNAQAPLLGMLKPYPSCRWNVRKAAEYFLPSFPPLAFAG